jgi:opacity protein-like surface antigen
MEPMKKHLRATCLLTAGLIGLFTLHLAAAAPDGGHAASGEEAKAWSVDIVPYVWIATYDGSFGLPGSPNTDSAGPYSTRLSGAAMLCAQVHYRQVGLFLDGAWLQLRTEGDAPSNLYRGTDIKSDIAYGTAALSYRLPEVGRLKTDLYAGARYWTVANELDFKGGLAPGFDIDDSRTWTDPLVGASLRYDFTGHWYATVLGDVGGFGVGSDLSWNVFAGAGYEFTSWCSATLGYRYLHVDYEKSGFEMAANVQGFLLGLGFHF